MPFPTIDNDLLDTGILQGQIPIIGAGNKLPASIINSGTSANQFVQLDNAAKLPALDASQLLNLPSGLGGGLVLLQTQIASGSTSISFSSTYLTTAYKHYIIMYSGVYGTIPPANYLYLTTSNNNGASYSTSGYTWAGQWQNPGSGTINGTGISNDSKIDITVQSGNFSNSASSPASGTINLFDITTPGVSTPTFMMEYNDFAFLVSGGGSISTGPINNIKIAPPSGTFNGTFKLYGVS